MLRTAYFQALAPDAQFPQTAFNLTLNRADYCLPVPLNVANFLMLVITLPDTFDCLEHYCNSLGIDILRHRPEAFEPARNRPTYAETMLSLKTSHGAQTLIEIAFNTIAAAEMVRLAEKEVIKDYEAISWVIKNRAFFEHCGGFVLALVHYSFSLTDYESDDGVIQITDPEGLLETRPRSTLLRQLLAAAEARS
jgi:hypothetical protein